MAGRRRFTSAPALTAPPRCGRCNAEFGVACARGGVLPLALQQPADADMGPMVRGGPLARHARRRGKHGKAKQREATARQRF
jgi:hypothetical protein